MSIPTDDGRPPVAPPPTEPLMPVPPPDPAPPTAVTPPAEPPDPADYAV